LFILLHACVTFAYAVTLHYELKTSGLDSAVYEQLLAGFLEGRGLYSSINPPYIPQPWLAFHFSPILFALAPLYGLFPHTETLLAVGSLAVALAAWPVFACAFHILANRWQALLVALLYLLCPFVLNGAVWGFHEIDFAPPAFAFALLAVLKQKRMLLLVACLLLLSIKEHYGVAVAGFGLLWAWQWKQWRFGALLAVAGLACVAVIFAVVIPHFNPTGAPIMMNPDSPEDRFSWLLSLEGLKANAAGAALSALWYGFALLGPFLFLPLASFAWLLPAAADAAANALSREDMMRSVYSYHSIALLPVILVACCQTLRKRFSGWSRFSANDMLLPITVSVAGFAYVQSALPLSDSGNPWELATPRFTYADTDMHAISSVNALTGGAPVAAQVNVLPHLAVREWMTPYPVGTQDATAQFIVLKLAFPFERALSVMGMPYGTSSSFYFTHVDSLLSDEGWGVVLYRDRWVVLKRGAKTDAEMRDAAREGLAGLREEFHEVRERYRKLMTGSR